MFHTSFLNLLLTIFKNDEKSAVLTSVTSNVETSVKEFIGKALPYYRKLTPYEIKANLENSR